MYHIEQNSGKQLHMFSHDRRRELSKDWSNYKRSLSVRGKMQKAADCNTNSVPKSWRNNIRGWDEHQSKGKSFFIWFPFFHRLMDSFGGGVFWCVSRIWQSFRRRGSVWRSSINRKWISSTRSFNKLERSTMPCRHRLTRYMRTHVQVYAQNITH